MKVQEQREIWGERKGNDGPINRIKGRHKLKDGGGGITRNTLRTGGR